MELRPHLQPPAVTAGRLAAVQARIEAIRGLLDRSDPGAGAAIAALNDATGHDYTAEELRDHCGAPELGELAAEAAAPPIRRVPGGTDVTRDELVEIVRRILAAGRHTDFYVAVFDANVVMPGASSFIFHPPAHLTGAGAAEIVDAALAYRPIAL